jgi:hypothetical protein
MSIGNYCDYRLKRDVAPLSGQLDKITSLRPISYTHMWDNAHYEGFIAHELQAVFPQCVQGRKDEAGLFNSPLYQSVNVGISIIASLVGAIKELNDKVATNKIEADLIKAQYNSMKMSSDATKSAHDALRAEFNVHKSRPVALAHPVV